MASSYQFCRPGACPGVSNTGTAPLERLGLIAEAYDPTYGMATFMYVRGASASTAAAGDAVMIDGGFYAMQAVSGNTASHGPMGIMCGAVSATNVYGWAQIEGVCDYAKIGTQGVGAVGVNLVIGTTAGRLQTTASATGFMIDGMYVSNYTTTAASNSGIVLLYWPVFNGIH